MKNPNQTDLIDTVIVILGQLNQAYHIEEGVSDAQNERRRDFFNSHLREAKKAIEKIKPIQQEKKLKNGT